LSTRKSPQSRLTDIRIGAIGRRSPVLQHRGIYVAVEQCLVRAADPDDRNRRFSWGRRRRVRRSEPWAGRDCG